MSWLSRLRNVFRKDELDSEIAEELRFHAEQRAADLGLPVGEGERRLGNMLRLREESRDVKLAMWLETLIQDIRVALRVWRKRPTIAMAAALTVMLGAGMNIALFEVIWTVMLRPLPYSESGRLIQVWVDDGKLERTPPRNTLIERWRERSRALSQLASYRPWRVTIVSGGDPEQVFSGVVSPEFFPMLGVRVLAGRAFSENEMKPGADNVAILREGYWSRRFGADAAILGREITVDGTLCTVIGIVPDSFLGTPLLQGARRGADAERGRKAEPDVYLPVSRARVAGTRGRVHTSFVVARLREGTTLEDAREELTSLAGAEERRRIWVSPLEREIGYKLRPALLALFLATACILLIACANLANLLLAHGVMRRRELAIRSALGAGRPRIIRQLVVEALVLLLVGTGAGVAAAQGISRAMTALYPDAIPRAGEGGSHAIAYLIGLGATVAIGLLFGTLPALRVAGEATQQGLRVGNLWMTRGTRRWADGMIAVQVGLTTVVLVAAGLLLKSFVQLRDAEIGIARDHLVTASVDLPEARFKTREERARFGAEWLKRLQAIPGVFAAGISNSLPLRYTTLLDVVLHVPGEAEPQAVGGRAVAGRYFDAMGMEWVAAGPFDENRRDQVVVNEAFVRKYLRRRAPIGTVLGAGKEMLTITGVVRDVRHLGLREPANPEVFMPFATFPLNPVDTVVRSSLPVAQVAAAMRRELRHLDGQLALGRVMSMNDVIDDHLAGPRFQAILLGLFGAVAIVLAAVGTYGVIAHSVRSRVPEFGIRRALGATTTDMLRLVLLDGMKAPVAGLAIGLLLGAIAVGRYLQTLLYGVAPRDAGVFFVAAGVLAVTSLLACAIPGRLAANVEASQALRHE